MKKTSENNFKELKELVYKYSFPENKTVEKLKRIDELMQWVTDEVLKTGMQIDEVKGLLGLPSVTMEDEEEINWLYPCLPGKDAVQVYAHNGWYWQLDFHKGVLVHFKKKKWLLDK